MWLTRGQSQEWCRSSGQTWHHRSVYPAAAWLGPHSCSLDKCYGCSYLPIQWDWLVQLLHWIRRKKDQMLHKVERGEPGYIFLYNTLLYYKEQQWLLMTRKIKAISLCIKRVTRNIHAFIFQEPEIMTNHPHTVMIITTAHFAVSTIQLERLMKGHCHSSTYLTGLKHVLEMISICQRWLVVVEYYL